MVKGTHTVSKKTELIPGIKCDKHSDDPAVKTVKFYGIITE